MAQTPIVMTPVTQLGASATVLYTQPANSIGQVLRAVAYNTDTVPRQMTIYRVPSGGSPGTNNILVSGQGGRVMNGQSVVVDVLAGMSLAAGDTIQGLADAGSVINFSMSGYINTGV